MNQAEFEASIEGDERARLAVAVQTSPKENAKAESSAADFREDNWQIRVFSHVRGIVTKLSVLITHIAGIPSALESTTSLGKMRRFRDTSATIKLTRTSYADARETRTTGRRPEGSGSSAHHTSPRFITRVPT